MTHEGLTLHEPGMFHKGWAYGLGGLTWFWIFYRFYKDGDTLIYGHAPHFEHSHMAVPSSKFVARMRGRRGGRRRGIGTTEERKVWQHPCEGRRKE